MAAVAVRKVQDDRNFKSGDMKVFLEFPWAIYKDDPNWVPPLVSFRRHLLDKGENPTWEYLDGDYYIAWRGEKPVGVIAAFVNKRHNEVWKETTGWFGFFECFDDQEAATALFQTAMDAVRAKGMSALRGPASFTLNDECALLIENFSRPVVLMPYNPPYYRRLIEESGFGFVKVQDMESWYDNRTLLGGEDGKGLPEKLVRVSKRAAERLGVTVRGSDVKGLKKDLMALKDVFADGWAKNWGAVPPTERETEQLFKDFSQYFDPAIASFAEKDGEMVGFAIAIPDMNQVLYKAHADPKTPEWITLLKAAWYWKIKPFFTRKPYPDACRVVFMGVRQKYRSLGIEAMVNLHLFEGYIQQTKYGDADAGWFLESNLPMLQFAKAMRAYPYKRYRIFEAPADPTAPKPTQAAVPEPTPIMEPISTETAE